MKNFQPVVVLIFLFQLVSSQETVDTSMVSKIRHEGMGRSQVMDMLWQMTDVYGPRLAGSPQYNAAAAWAVEKMDALGIATARMEEWGPFGRSWELKNFSATMIGRQIQPLIAYPKAWTTGLKGRVEADVVYLNVDSAEQLDGYKGTLKGKFVLLSKPSKKIEPYWTPLARRETDSSLLLLANAGEPSSERRRRSRGSESLQKTAWLNYHKWQFLMKENVAAVLTASFSTKSLGGSVAVQQAYVLNHPDTPYASPYRVRIQSSKAPAMPPQIEVGAEHYNRLVRLALHGERVRLAVELETAMSQNDVNSYNITGEIPGGDLKDEVVMIGAHFDSWHGGTGATDNGSSSAVCMEAMRILTAVGAKPRRTIRIGLWSAEEQGLIGSEEYVKKNFGSKNSLTDAGKKISAYFNLDNGSGKIRGVYLQGNESVRPIFRSWLEPLKDLNASTLTLHNTGSTDHMSFDAVGIPAFQFIQDPLEYSTRTHHTTMDLFDRVQEDDLKQAAVIVAAFAYHAAMRDALLPRKESRRIP